MKSKFLKVNTPCTENWQNMMDLNDGKFCDSCSKSVLDFTKLSTLEISKKLKSNKEICAKTTRQQTKEPLIYSQAEYNFKIPYSKNIAATGLILSTSLVSCQQQEAKQTPIELIAAPSDEKSTEKQISNTSDIIKNESNSGFSFRGKIYAEEKNSPIKNAKVMLVTTQEIITAYTLDDGSFSMEVPPELIDDDNVIRVTYYEVEQAEAEDKYFEGFENSDYILSKQEINSDYTINAQPNIIILGGIGSYQEELNPIVIENGVQIKYREFEKALVGKKSSCNLENKDYLYFEPKEAIAIYGKKAKDGLYILKPKTD